MIWRTLTFFLLLALLVSWSNPPVSAHNYNNGYSYVRILEDRLEYEQLLPFPIMLKYDTNRNNIIEADEVARQRADIEAYVLEHLTLYNNEQRMEAKIEDVSTIIQEKTEVPMVRIFISFTSPIDIGNITISYNLMFDDVDDTHLNYIVLNDAQDNILEHWLIEKGTGPVRYSPDNNFRFDLSLMGKYTVFGAQKMLFNVYCWLLLLFVLLTSPTVRESLLSLGTCTLYTLLGLIINFRLGGSLLASWLPHVALLVFGAYMLCLLFFGRGAFPKVTSALFGFTWGTGSISIIQDLNLNNQFKVISLFFYYFGAALAWGGLLYVFYVLFDAFFRSSRFAVQTRSYFIRKRMFTPEINNGVK